MELPVITGMGWVFLGAFILFLLVVLAADIDDDTIEARQRARKRYRHEVERDFHDDLEVPAFLRETAATRRSRYIGKRPA